MLNKYALLLLMAGSTRLALNAQDNTILVYDPLTQQVDTIQPMLPTDTVEAFLPHNPGTLPGWEALTLEASPPGFLGPVQQRPPRAAASLDLLRFPVRAAGALRRVETDSTWARCTGQLVGPWHVLTASHCLRSIGTGEWRTGQIYFYPTFDNGVASPFDSARAVRYYVPLIQQHDNALIELDHPIGTELGWIGLGFTTDPAFFNDRIVQKFSYPADASMLGNSVPYNGDTLYHMASPMVRFTGAGMPSVGVSNWMGVPGESGSGVWITDNINYQVLGVLSWSSAYRHTLMDAGTFAQFRTILEDPSIGISDVQLANAQMRVWPNPAADHFSLSMGEGLPEGMYGISIRDLRGREVERTQFRGHSCTVQRNGLAPGVYLLQLTSWNGTSLSGRVVFE